MTQTLLISVEVSDPKETSPGVFTTQIHHPSLNGSFSFIHSNDAQRSLVLNELNASVTGELSSALRLVKEFVNDNPFKLRKTSDTSTNSDKSVPPK